MKMKRLIYRYCVNRNVHLRLDLDLDDVTKCRFVLSLSQLLIFLMRVRLGDCVRAVKLASEHQTAMVLSIQDFRRRKTLSFQSSWMDLCRAPQGSRLQDRAGGQGHSATSGMGGTVEAGRRVACN